MSVKIDDRAYRALMRRLGASDMVVKAGVLGSKGGGETEGDSDLTVAGVAFVHEFGSDDGRIPERSFIRRTCAVHEREIAKMQAELGVQVLQGTLTMERAHDLLGAFVAGEIKKLVAEGEHIPPELAESTVKRKGSTRPLVDHGQMVGAIGHEVSK